MTRRGLVTWAVGLIVALGAWGLPAFQPAAFAANCGALNAPIKTFTGATDDDWGTASNWSPSPPGATDSVCILPGIVAHIASTDTVTVEAIASDSPLTIAGSLTITGANGASTFDDNIINSGTLALTGSVVMNGTLYNNATLDMNNGGESFSGTGSLTNNGDLNYAGTGTLTISTALVNSSGHALAIQSGEIDASNFPINRGSLYLGNNVTLSTVGHAFSDGTIPSGGGFISMNDQTSTIDLGGQTLTVSPAAGFNGWGTLTGSVHNYGNFSVASDIPAGSFAVSGDFTSESASGISTGADGTTAVTHYGQLQVAGTFHADGSIYLYASPYAPNNGDTFDIVTSATATGSIDYSSSDISAPQTVAADVAATRTRLTVGNMGDISGHVYVDTNGNGIKDSGEPASVGTTVYADDIYVNDVYDAGENTATSNGSGAYSMPSEILGPDRPLLIDGLSAGTHVTYLPDPFDVALNGVYTNKDFGLFDEVSATGSIYDDVNANGTKDAGESGLSGETVFLDQNNNGSIDSGEPTATTNGSGVYTFTGVVGPQNIRVLAGAGRQQTPAGPRVLQVSSGVNATNVDIGVRATGAQDSMNLGSGYWMTSSDGTVLSFGTAGAHGSARALHPAAATVDLAPTPSGAGYLQLGADGGVFAFGDAHFYGAPASLHLRSPATAIAETPTGNGYWVVAADGGVFSYGDAQFYGSAASLQLAGTITSIIPTASGHGYWLIGEDGGVFCYGDAQFQGSAAPYHPVRKIVGAARAGAGGYWLVGEDGGVFSFGGAPFHGSAASLQLRGSIVAIRAKADQSGYWLFGSDGGVFAYGSVTYAGNGLSAGVNIAG